MTPLEVDALPLEDLRTHRSTKWRDFPADVLPLPVAEMDFPVAAPIRELLLEMVSCSDLGYLGPAPELSLAFQSFALTRWKWELDPAQVHLATDVGVGVVEVLRLFAQAGDQVLLSSPVYHNFYTWIREAHLKSVDVPFESNGLEWNINFDAIETAYQNGVKIHLLCNPHNPLGRLYTKEELTRIAILAEQYSVLVISDEIHGPLTFPGSAFVPFLSIGRVAESVGVVITAASKAWNIAGLKCALVVSQSEKMTAELKRLPPAMHYRASLLGAFASATAFAECGDWLDAVIRKLDSNRRFLQQLLRINIPEIKYRMPDNSYLAWLDLSALGLGENPAKVLLDRGRVGLNEGGSFGPNTSQFVRLNFATSESILTEAVDRMVVALA